MEGASHVGCRVAGNLGGTWKASGPWVGCAPHSRAAATPEEAAERRAGLCRHRGVEGAGGHNLLLLDSPLVMVK